MPISVTGASESAVQQAVELLQQDGLVMLPRIAEPTRAVYTDAEKQSIAMRRALCQLAGEATALAVLPGWHESPVSRCLMQVATAMALPTLRVDLYTRMTDDGRHELAAHLTPFTPDGAASAAPV